MSICDRYSEAFVPGSNGHTSQYTFLTPLTKTVILGNFTGKGSRNSASPGSLNQVPRILTAGTTGDEAVDLHRYLNGSLLPTNCNGSPSSVYFIDSMSPAGSSFNTFLYHLITYFATLRGCSHYGTAELPAYDGSNSQWNAHKYMDLSNAEFSYFVNQVKLAATSFNMTNDDAATIGDNLQAKFGYRCAPAISVAPSSNEEQQVICAGQDCPVAPGVSDCGNAAIKGITAWRVFLHSSYASIGNLAFWPTVRRLRGVRLLENMDAPVAGHELSKSDKEYFSSAVDEILLSQCNSDPDGLHSLLGRIKGLKTFCLEYNDGQNDNYPGPKQREWSPNELCEVIERFAGETLVNLSLTFSVFGYGDRPTVPIRSLRGFQQLRWLEVQAFIFFEEPNFFAKARDRDYMDKYWVQPGGNGRRRDSSKTIPVGHDSLQRLRDVLPASLHTLRLDIKSWLEEACVIFVDFEAGIEERLPCLQLVEVACHYGSIPPSIRECLDRAKIPHAFIGRDMIPWHVPGLRALQEEDHA